MELRTLGRTGVQVSPLCLGAMMFGAWGNRDHDDSSRSSTARSTPGINFIDTADVYSARRVGGDRRQGAGRRAARRRRAGHQGPRPDGRRPQPVGNSRRWIVREVEDSLRRLAPTRSTSTRSTAPTPTRDIDETLGALTDLVRAGQGRATSAPRRSRPAEIVEAQWVARAARARALRVRAAALLAAGARRRGRRAAHLPALRHGRDPLEPARRRLAVGPLPQGRRTCPSTTRAERMPRRYDMSLPGNQRKLEAADALARLADEAGISLVHLALAFVLRHPAVTAAIIGPRTMEQLESPARRRRRRARRRRARPHRRDRPARRQPQPHRRRLRQPGAPPGGAAAVAPHPTRSRSSRRATQSPATRFPAWMAPSR